MRFLRRIFPWTRSPVSVTDVFTLPTRDHPHALAVGPPVKPLETESRKSAAPAGGFSLVEVTLALGVFAVAFLALFGLLPRGLEIFRQAMGVSIGAQIAQRVINEAQQTDFDVLTDHVARDDASADGLTFRAPSRSAPLLRYFDDQGTEIAAGTTGSLSRDAALHAIYYVNTRITVRAARPQSGGATTDGGSSARHLASVTVEVATNPGHRTLAFSTAPADSVNEPGRNLFKPDPSLKIATWSALVARNQPSP